MKGDDHPIDYLSRLGRSGDGPHDIATAALMLASLDYPSLPLAPARAHLAEIAELARIDSPLISTAQDAVRPVSNLLATRLGYDGDRLNYDDPRNANLLQVIARRRGMPVALGILYMHAARAAGLKAAGLDTPAHFLVQFRVGDSEAVIDPFNGGVMIDPETAGALPRMAAAQGIHLAQPVSDTDVLIRLQNNLKLRAIRAGEREKALEIAKRMVLIGPGKAELWLDLARLNEAVGVLRDARKAYEACLEIARPGQSLHNEAALGLSGLKRLIN